MRSFRARRPWTSAAAPALLPADVAQLYGLGGLYSQDVYGQGQSIGFVEFALPQPGDDAAFWSRYSLRPQLNRPAAATVLPRSRSSPSAVDETDLDLQYAGALAPGAALTAYVVDGSAPLDEFLPMIWAALRAAAADGVRTVSISLGAGDAEVASLGPIRDPYSSKTWPDAATFCAELDGWVRAQGMLVFVSAGDSGAYGGYPADTRVQACWPASQPGFVAVGGTQLAVPGETASAEQAWGGQTLDSQLPGYSTGNTLSSASGGGGLSAFLPAPAYQARLRLPARAVPDVAAFSGPLLVVDRGARLPVWGTSASAPILAAVAALYAQAAGRQLDHAVLYAAASDVLDGCNWNNTLLQEGLNAYAHAGVGYDLCTGMGLLRATALPGL